MYGRSQWQHRTYSLSIFISVYDTDIEQNKKLTYYFTFIHKENKL